MTEPGAPEARLRRSRGLTLVWLVPLAALGIVVWLGMRTLLERGPLVTITFQSAEGLEAGRTKVRHKAVDVGTVESVRLTSDLSHVVVTARIDRELAGHVTRGTKFWVVRPRLSPGGISGLNTIVSGSYIEMEPGPAGDEQDRFEGLEEPPVIAADQAGRRFTLHADTLGSLGQGSPVYYSGIAVGEVLGSQLVKDGNGVDIYIFVRAPYENLVHPQSRFWNASGFSISAGAGGVKANVESLQALVTGGVAFETVPEARLAAASPAGAEFRLFGDQSAAEAEPIGQKVFFLVRFPGAVHGLGAGSPVELDGMPVGEATEVHLEYDPASGTLSTPAVIEIEPERIRFVDAAPPRDGNYQPLLEAALGKLVENGLRARLATGSLLTGQRIVALGIEPDAAPAKLDMSVTPPEIPAVEGGDLDALTHSATRVMDKLSALPLQEIGQSLSNVLDHLDHLTGSPEMTRAVRSLDLALANLQKVTASADTDLPPLLKSLRQTADAATRTLATANRALGAAGQRDSDLPGLLHQLSEAARSVRALADFLDEHPEALLRGRSGTAQ